MTFDNIQSPDVDKTSNISVGGNTVSSITIDGNSVSTVDSDGTTVFGGTPSTFDFSSGDSRNFRLYNSYDTGVINGTAVGNIYIFNSITESQISPFGEWVMASIGGGYKLRNATISQGDAPFSVWIQHTDDYNSFDAGFTFADSSYPDNNNTGYYLYTDDRNEFGIDSDGRYGTELQLNTPTIDIGVWYELAVTTWDTNGNIDAELRDVDGNVLSTISVTDTNYTSGGIVLQHGGSDFGGPTLVGEINL